MSNTTSDQKLYLMKNELGLYKIGISKHPDVRVSQIKNTSGFDVELLQVYEPLNCDAHYLEQELHKFFSNFRQKGEWFLFEDTEIEEFNKQIFNLDLVTVIIPEHNPFVVFTNFDENKINDVLYLEEFYNFQMKYLEDLSNTDSHQALCLINELIAKDFIINPSISYQIKAGSNSLRPCFSLLLETIPVVEKRYINDIKITYITQIISEFTTKLEGLNALKIDG